MKKQLITTALAIISVATVHAQNTFPPTGNVGIGTSSPATSLQVIGTSRLGGAANYAQFDVNGSLSFTGASTYKVGGNRYAFQYSGGNYGLFFNTSNSQYEFRNSAALPVFSVNWLTGNGVLNGSLKVGAYTLPATDGINGQVLKTNGAGALIWAADSNTATAAWLLSGNSGTNPATQFIGTKDAKALVFKVNNIRSGFIEADELKNTTAWGQYALLSNTGAGNTAIGYKSLFSNSTGYDNTSTGSSSLYFNTTGNDNTATGYQSLNSNSTGSFNTANGSVALSFNTTGDENTAVGYATLFNNTTGSSNTATGSDALTSNTTGSGNTALGKNALYHNTTGYSNTAAGVYSLHNNSTGNHNTAFGDSTLIFNTTGNDNLALGAFALYSNTTGYDNIANGSIALYSNTTGNNNTANGIQALYSNTTGNNNIATGVGSLFLNTTGSNNTANGPFALQINTTGHYNTAVGSYALGVNSTGSYNTAEGAQSLSENYGDNNTATGYNALAHNTTGYSNVAIGTSSLFVNSTRSNLVAIGDSALYNNGQFAVNAADATGNVAVGSKALFTNTTGSYNTANGIRALFANNTGFNNTATGGYTLSANTSGNYNTADGYNALANNTTGSYNTANGYSALFLNSTGNRNTALGYNAGVSTSSLSNAMALGYGASVNASNKVAVGNTSVTVIGGQVGWSILSDGRFKTNIQVNVPGLTFINKLKPVTYTLQIKKLDQFLGKKDSLTNSMQSEYAVTEKKVHTGFIAQEVEKAAQEIHYDFDGINHPQNEKDNYSLVYADFVPSLVKAIQELSSQVDQLNEKIKSLEQGNGNSSTSSNANEQVNTITLSNARLDQNTPNPFGQTTYIKYYVPSTVKQAQIIIADMNGKTVKQEIINVKENGQINIDAAALSAGTYTYTLYIDGKRIDAKQMIHL